MIDLQAASPFAGQPMAAGERYGRLVTVSKHRNPDVGTSRHRYQWECVCDCGSTCLVSPTSLRTGHTRSCGCLRNEVRRARLTRHGMTNTGTWRSWFSMIVRTTSVNHNTYPLYGGRGITVCDRWRDSFEAFLADMGERPRGHTLDRIDNHKGYDISNCRWATYMVQSRNRRNVRLSAEKADEATAMARSGLKPKAIAAALGVDSALINSHIYKLRKRGQLPPSQRTHGGAVDV